MMKRRFLAAGVVLLALLAGCDSGGGEDSVPVTPGGGNTTVTDDPSPDVPETPSLKAVSAEQQEMLDAFALALDDAPHTTKTIEVINDQYYKSARWTGWKETCLDEDGNLTGYIWDLKRVYVMYPDDWYGVADPGEIFIGSYDRQHFNKYGRLLSLGDMAEDDNENLTWIGRVDTAYRHDNNKPPTYDETYIWYEIAKNDFLRKDNRLEFDDSAGGYVRDYSYASYRYGAMYLTGTSQYLGDTETNTFERVTWKGISHSLQITRRQNGLSWIPEEIEIDGEEYDPNSVTFSK